MKNVIIDTNTLISFVTDRNLDQQQKVAGLFEQASRLKSSVVCHQNVVAEFVYVMDKLYCVEKEKIGNMLTDFLKMPGVSLSTVFDSRTVFELWPNKVADFGDAIVASLYKSYRKASIATFDVRFKKALKRLSIATYDFEG